jgi:hypothetical protein
MSTNSDEDSSVIRKRALKERVEHLKAMLANDEKILKEYAHPNIEQCYSALKDTINNAVTNLERWIDLLEPECKHDETKSNILHQDRRKLAGVRDVVQKDLPALISIESIEFDVEQFGKYVNGVLRRIEMLTPELRQLQDIKLRIRLIYETIVPPDIEAVDRVDVGEES